MRLSVSDPSSYAQPDQLTLRHVDLDWTVQFDQKIIKAVAFLRFKVVTSEIQQIVLDVKDIKIRSILFQQPAEAVPIDYIITDTVEEIGSKLTIFLPSKVKRRVDILISYETSPEATGLTWLSSEATCGKKFPFLYSQCQPHHARSILPCQDTPAVKFTYTAVLRHPSHLTGLMSAIRTYTKPGCSYFQQALPIPSYLLAVVVAKLVAKPLGPRSKVWAEKEQVIEAARDLAFTESYLKAAEEICGPYLWKQYDIVIVAPNFKYGGMENPCLTFIAPPIANALPLEKIVAHEIAHSWAGNLVTNMNHEHLWVNEGFTTFVEGKILARTISPDYSDYIAKNGLGYLEAEINTNLKDAPQLTKLITDLTDVNPDRAFNITAPFFKGSIFLRYIEQTVGGEEKFLPFLRHFFRHNKFKSIATEDFLRQLFTYFSDDRTREALSEIHWNAWLHGEGMPPEEPHLSTQFSETADAHATLWTRQTTEDALQSPLLQQTLSPIEIQAFLTIMLSGHEDKIVDFTLAKVSAIADAYRLNEVEDVVTQFNLMMLYLRLHRPEKIRDILAYTHSPFRLDFALGIYEEFIDWPEMRPQAIQYFEDAKEGLLAYIAEKIDLANKLVFENEEETDADNVVDTGDE